MNVQDWLRLASTDADARGLTGLRPLLEALARSTQALRDADLEFGHPRARSNDDDDPA
jgi:IS5 family transposase